ncbi:MAG TPA: hypothetical protein VK453_06870 [Micromonosporaceae bacterium]|nr:hypothetical protein [Micromonosporaceae bacterium]
MTGAPPPPQPVVAGDEAPAPRELMRGMRLLLLVAAGLVLLAGTQLFVFTERTDEYFAWTIGNPLTAAFLGAAYWGSFVIEALAARERRWADARITVPTVLVFTVLTLAVTLAYLEVFHLGAEYGLNTQVVTWLWIAIYAVVPVLLIVVLVVQLRAPGTDPPRDAPPPRWLFVVIVAQALVMLLLGAWLFLDPLGVAAAVWPWDLTPLTGRAVGAWLLSFGVAASHAVVERDLRRLRPAGWGYLATGALQLAALARYPDVPDGGSPRTWLYVAFLVSMLVVGATAVLGGRTVAGAGARERTRTDPASVDR